MLDKKKVILGMSGGTGSSVTAMLLLVAGLEVVGVTCVLCYGVARGVDYAMYVASTP